jgi:hypothetical protein
MMTANSAKCSPRATTRRSKSSAVASSQRGNAIVPCRNRSRGRIADQANTFGAAGEAETSAIARIYRQQPTRHVITRNPANHAASPLPGLRPDRCEHAWPRHRDPSEDFDPRVLARMSSLLALPVEYGRIEYGVLPVTRARPSGTHRSHPLPEFRCQRQKYVAPVEPQSSATPRTHKRSCLDRKPASRSRAPTCWPASSFGMIDRNRPSRTTRTARLRGEESEVGAA